MNAQEWNSKFPTGTHVSLTLANGEIVWTRTASAAETWGGMSHVKVEAISQGYVPLDWVRALEVAA